MSKSYSKENFAMAESKMNMRFSDTAFELRLINDVNLR